jgi:GT2 family glycosyltransferase
MKEHKMSEHTCNNTPVTMKLEGKIDGLFGQGICGWVWCPDMPQQRLWVEAVVDGCSMGIARAENYHPDAAGCADACYGFWIALPAFVRTEAGQIQVQVANSGATFAPPLCLKSQKPTGKEKNKPQLTRVYSDGGLRLSGWAVDPGAPDEEVRVRAWHNGRRILSQIADSRRFDPDISDGHGFDITLPLEFADGELHIIEVTDDKGIPLSGSPVAVKVLTDGILGWVKQQQITPANIDFVREMIGQYEKCFSHSVGFLLYPQWRKCFPALVEHAGDAAASSAAPTLPVCPASATLAQLRRIAGGHEGVILLAGGSALYPEAQHLLHECARTSGAALVYADADTHDGADRGKEGSATVPRFKPAWDPFLFAGSDYLDTVYIRSDFLSQVDFPEHIHSLELRTRLILAAAEQGKISPTPAGIVHLPQVLSRAEAQSLDAQEHSLRCEILTQWYAHAGIKAHIEPHSAGGCTSCNQVGFALQEEKRVSIIIPTRDRADLLRVCLESLWHHTSYAHTEIIIVDNASCEAETMALFAQAREKGARVLEYPHPFNYSAMNNMAAQHATGEVLCFLNNDTEVITPDWLEQMLAILEQPGVGAVGAKLLWPNNLIQHGGVVVGPHQLAAHVGNQWHTDAPGYMGRAQLVQQWSAVTAACLLTPRQLFLDSGSFDVLNFPVAFNDVDYCLRLRQRGKHVVWTPQARLYHHESASRGSDTRKHDQARNRMEMWNFRDKWGEYADPFYNPNLTLSTVSEPFNGLALPPRNRECRT